MIRVVIADDHQIVHKGIQALLQGADDIQVIGTAVDGDEAIELVKRLSPDVLLMDLAMPRVNGMQVLEQMRSRKISVPVVVFSVRGDESRVRHALRLGARGYVLKRSVPDEIVAAIRAVSQGGAYLSPTISESVVSSLDTASPFEQLTPREREVLSLVAEGLTSAQIAGKLCISLKTAVKHRANLMSKLDVHDVAGLIREAAKHGLIQFEE